MGIKILLYPAFRGAPLPSFYRWDMSFHWDPVPVHPFGIVSGFVAEPVYGDTALPMPFPTSATAYAQERSQIYYFLYKLMYFVPHQ